MKIRYALRAAALLAAIGLPLAAGSITTTFANNNQFTGNMFNAIIGANGITVNSLDVNVDTGSMTIDVYLKSGTFVGFDTTPAAWTLVSATAVTGAGAGKPTLVNVSPFTLAAGNTLWALCNGGQHNQYRTLHALHERQQHLFELGPEPLAGRWNWRNFRQFSGGFRPNLGRNYLLQFGQRHTRAGSVRALLLAVPGIWLVRSATCANIDQYR